MRRKKFSKSSKSVLSRQQKGRHDAGLWLIVGLSGGDQYRAAAGPPQPNR
jgi:hypothetical protein